MFTVGSETRTKVALVYMNTKADNKIVEKISKKLESLNVKATDLTQENISYHIFCNTKTKMWNPFPKVRYIERPDIAATMILEGKILIFCDTTPTVIAIPMSLFDFFEESEDYYYPPFIGSYLKIIRILTFILSIYVSPIWLLTVLNKNILPQNMSFLLINDEYAVPLYLQLLIIEIAIDALKLASLNTPSSLSNSLSVVGGLLLGDYAVKSGWFVPQTILYSAFTAIASFVPTNYELGYCFKFTRIFLIIAVQIAGIYGLIFGSLLFITVLSLNKSVNGKSYLYPLVPFNKKALKKIIVKGVNGRENENQ